MSKRIPRNQAQATLELFHLNHLQWKERTKSKWTQEPSSLWLWIIASDVNDKLTSNDMSNVLYFSHILSQFHVSLRAKSFCTISLFHSCRSEHNLSVADKLWSWQAGAGWTPGSWPRCSPACSHSPACYKAETWTQTTGLEKRNVTSLKWLFLMFVPMTNRLQIARKSATRNWLSRYCLMKTMIQK